MKAIVGTFNQEKALECSNTTQLTSKFAKVRLKLYIVTLTAAARDAVSRSGPMGPGPARAGTCGAGVAAVECPGQMTPTDKQPSLVSDIFNLEIESCSKTITITLLTSPVLNNFAQAPG